MTFFQNRFYPKAFFSIWGCPRRCSECGRWHWNDMWMQKILCPNCFFDWLADEYDLYNLQD